MNQELETKINNDKSIKWLYCQSINSEEWTIRHIGKALKNIEDSRMFDETPIGVINQSDFAIFRNRPNWRDYHPRYFASYRDRSNDPINGLGGLINSLDSSWF
jgi:hypothetical protein